MSTVKLKYSLTLCLLLFATAVFSQLEVDSVRVLSTQILVTRDTVFVPTSDTLICLPQEVSYKIKDNPYLKSQAFFDSLQVSSETKEWRKKLYDALIVASSKEKPKVAVSENLYEHFKPFENHRIRSIRFHQVDMLEGNVMDTSIVATGGLSKMLNKSHVTTREKVLRKNLLFNEGDKINAHRLSDNERVFRALNFIEDARIEVVPVDSLYADILIITKDVFPVGVKFYFSSLEKSEILLEHRNIFGYGQSVGYTSVFNSNYYPMFGHQLRYKLNNIGNNFTSLDAVVRKTALNEKVQFRIKKPFVSPDTKYGGGLLLQYLKDQKTLDYPDSSVRNDFSRNVQDVWLGRSIKLNEAERINLVVSGKYERYYYIDRPEVGVDTNQVFINSNLYLSELVLLKNRNVKTRYLRSFGRTEDVRIGYLFSLLSGVYRNEYSSSFYGGVRAGWGHYLKKGGYLGMGMGLGGFVNDNTIHNGVFTYGALWFSPLIKAGRANVRIDCEFIYQHGINRYPYEWINLKDEVDGLKERDTRGRSKTALTSELVYFSDTYMYGFKFAPYVSADLGLIRNGSRYLHKGSPHLGLGIGVRLRNESLIFQTLDISFVIYPINATSSRQFALIVNGSEPELIKHLDVGEPQVIDY